MTRFFKTLFWILLATGPALTLARQGTTGDSVDRDFSDRPRSLADFDDELVERDLLDFDAPHNFAARELDEDDHILQARSQRASGRGRGGGGGVRFFTEAGPGIYSRGLDLEEDQLAAREYDALDRRSPRTIQSLMVSKGDPSYTNSPRRRKRSLEEDEGLYGRTTIGRRRTEPVINKMFRQDLLQRDWDEFDVRDFDVLEEF